MRLDLYPLSKETDDGLLTRIIEECGEVIVAASKCKRFGLGNHHPDRSINNISELIEELTDVAICYDELKKRIKNESAQSHT